MKKINWKVRLKNKTTLTALIGAVFLFVKQIAEVFGFDLSVQLEQIGALVGAVITLLVTLGVIVDGTTKGIKDSEKAQEYTKPRDDKDPNQFLQWEADSNTLTPEEFDTREPFSDDSDEVEFYQTLLTGGESPDSVTVEEDEEQPEDDSEEGLGQRPETPEVKEVK